MNPPHPRHFIRMKSYPSQKGCLAGCPFWEGHLWGISIGLGQIRWFIEYTNFVTMSIFHMRPRKLTSLNANQTPKQQSMIPADTVTVFSMRNVMNLLE